MDQNEQQKNAAGNSAAQSQNDRRTFLIAFLTTVTLLALYHFGTGLFAIFSGTSDFCTIPVTREYVLVPVNALPRGGGMMNGGPRGPFQGPRRGPGNFGRGAMPQGGLHRHNAEGPHHADSPAAETPAPEKPAE